MKLEGRILLFDAVNKNEDIFPKTCEINIPERMPLLWDFQFDRCIGHCEAAIDEKGITVKAVTFSDKTIEDTLKDILSDGKIGVGGFYNNVKTHNDNNLIVVDEATLRCVSLTLKPVNKEYSLEIVKEKENE